jgi:hypothetical protein
MKILLREVDEFDPIIEDAPPQRQSGARVLSSPCPPAVDLADTAVNPRLY